MQNLPYSILLIESNPNHQAMYKIMLGKTINCNISIVNNELEALVLIPKININLVIIGGSISSNSSRDLIRYIKTLPSKVYIPILKISATLSKNDLEEYIKLGVDDIVLSFDFNINTFIQKVLKLLKKQSSIILQSLSKQKYYEMGSENIEKSLQDLKAIKQPGINESKTPVLKPKVVKKIDSEILNTNILNQDEVIHTKTSKSDKGKKVLSEAKLLISESFLEKKLSKVAAINALPFIVSELLNLTSSVNTDIKDLIKLIETDYALTARVLKLSNSAFYKRTGSRVLNLNDAIKQVGFYGLRDLALAVGAIKALEDNSDGSDLDRIKLWFNSFVRAVAAKELATLAKHKMPESCFVAGLLCDVGIAILKEHFSKEFEQVIGICIEYDLPLYVVEKKLIGLYHNEISHKILKQWNFPQNIIAPILYVNLTYQDILNLDSTHNKIKEDILLLKLANSFSEILCGTLLKSEAISDLSDEIFESSFVKLTAENIIENAIEIKGAAKELMQIMLLHVEPEVIMDCDVFDRYKLYEPYRCLLSQSKPISLHNLELIFKEINFKMKQMKNPHYAPEIINNEKPDALLFDINESQIGEYTSEYLGRLYQKVNSKRNIVFAIISSESIINKYKKDLGNPDDYLFLKKPYMATDVCKFLEKMIAQIRERK
ncbi:MAG: response regulator [Cyanobacteriota bacterium]